VKQARVRFFWSRSPSTNATAQRLEIVKNGTLTAIDFPPEVEEYVADIMASTGGEFRVITLDTEGNEVSSDSFPFVLGDLEKPLPATGLGIEIMAVSDVPDEPPPV